MARKSQVDFPLPAVPTDGSFAKRYELATRRHEWWEKAASANKHLIALPEVLHCKWLHSCTMSLFKEAGDYVWTAPDLRSLSVAVRRLAWGGPLGGIGPQIDAGEGNLLIYTLVRSIPTHIAIRTQVPHIDDALYLLGEPSRARFDELTERFGKLGHLEHFLKTLNMELYSKRVCDKRFNRSAYWAAQGGPFSTPRLVQPLPWADAKGCPFGPLDRDAPLVPLSQAREERLRDWWNPEYRRLACRELLHWRRQILLFCRKATRLMAEQEQPIDTLPIDYGSTDTFERLADLILDRASQAVRFTATIRPKQTGARDKGEPNVIAPNALGREKSLQNPLEGADKQVDANVRLGTDERDETNSPPTRAISIPNAGNEKPEVPGPYRIQDTSLIYQLGSPAPQIKLTPGELRVMSLLIAAGVSGLVFSTIAKPPASYARHISQIKSKLSSAEIPDLIVTPGNGGKGVGGTYSICS